MYVVFSSKCEGMPTSEQYDRVAGSLVGWTDLQLEVDVCWQAVDRELWLK